MTKNKFESFKKGLTRKELKKLTNEELEKIAGKSLERLEKIEGLYERLPLTEKEFNGLAEDERLELTIKYQLPLDFYDIRRQCFSDCIMYLDIRKECCLWLIGDYLIQAYKAGKGDFDKK
ncbi:MAG: hypothetical protein NT094_03815 [Candidatus Staskawiczbacteria bacterium]|nr:hypothetical protein [Candidatus Staskawiczbacteria bacterium]